MSNSRHEDIPSFVLTVVAINLVTTMRMATRIRKEVEQDLLVCVCASCRIFKLRGDTVP